MTWPPSIILAFSQTKRAIPCTHLCLNKHIIGNSSFKIHKIVTISTIYFTIFEKTPPSTNNQPYGQALGYISFPPLRKYKTCHSMFNYCYLFPTIVPFYNVHFGLRTMETRWDINKTPIKQMRTNQKTIGTKEQRW